MWTGECWRHFTEPGEPNPGIDVLDMMLLLYFGEAPIYSHSSRSVR